MKGGWVCSVLLVLLSLILAFPFFWLVLGSFKSNAELFAPLALLPSVLSLEYYRDLFTGGWLPYGSQYASTILIVLVQTALVLLTSSAAGFVFAHYAFPGRRFLYALALSAIFIPRQVLIVPLLEWLIPLGLTDSRWGVILPGSVSALGLLFFTEMARRLPPGLFDAARLEGASEGGLYTRIALPLLRPALVTYGFIHALLAAHETLLPLIVLSTPQKLPVTVGLGSLFGSFLRLPYAVILAGFVLAAQPFIVAYVFGKGQFRSVLREFLEG
jgi:ABC-type glycerol-3-phosphate transport system permease component